MRSLDLGPATVRVPSLSVTLSRLTLSFSVLAMSSSLRRSWSSEPPPVRIRNLSSSRHVTVSSEYTVPLLVNMWHSVVLPGRGTLLAVAMSKSRLDSGLLDTCGRQQKLVFTSINWH